jgi:allophanate hydrolase
MLPDTLLISDLLTAYRSARTTPAQLLEHVLARMAAAPERNAWIHRLAAEQVLGYAHALESRAPDSLPLYGVPFAIKDNIDLAGVPTTAGCPDFVYTPKKSAHVVSRLIEAGAIPIGKTNLDQFATGLVGTRSPYGACRNSFDPNYIAGGSSSGSAVVVATGLASFALGTDTAGSGRVPAAFNNLIGLKPSCGALSTRGVVPACRSLDCLSIFALTACDAARVHAVTAGYDPEDPYSRPLERAQLKQGEGRVRFGVPRAGELEFFGDGEYARLFAAVAGLLPGLGGEVVEIDLEPFLAAAKLLYEGPWVAERYCAVGDFLEERPQSMHPVTRQIIEAGRRGSAVDAFRAQYRLMELKRASAAVWSAADVLVTPTAGTIYRIEELEADPIRLNSNLGYYTNFVNLFDLAAVAVPCGARSDGLPFGVTLIASRGSDLELLRLAARLHRAGAGRLGALDVPVPEQLWPEAARTTAAQHAEGEIALAVCGAHMEGLPLNHQLLSRGARLLARTRTAAKYRFYALPGGPPRRPGLLRVQSGGAAIEVEVWSVPAASFGSFVAGIPAPLGIGKIELESGEAVSGFLCEAHATIAAEDITELGSWRRYPPP